MSDSFGEASAENMSYGVQTPQEQMESPDYGWASNDEDVAPVKNPLFGDQIHAIEDSVDAIEGDNLPDKKQREQNVISSEMKRFVGKNPEEEVDAQQVSNEVVKHIEERKNGLTEEEQAEQKNAANELEAVIQIKAQAGAQEIFPLIQHGNQEAVVSALGKILGKEPPADFLKRLFDLNGAPLQELTPESLQKLLAEAMPIEGAVQGLIEANDYRKLMNKLRQTDLGEDVVSTLRLYSQTSKSMDSVDVNGFFNLIFDTRGGYGSYGGFSTYEGWGEKRDDDKEKKSLTVIQKIMKSEQAAQVFFANVVKEPGETVDKAKVQEVFSSGKAKKFLDNDIHALKNLSGEERAEKMKNLKKKVSDAVRYVSDEVQGFAGLTLNVEDVNFSEDVLRYITAMALDYQDKSSGAPSSLAA